MHKKGHIVCIMSILCLEDYLTMPEVLGIDHELRRNGAGHVM